MTALRLAQIQQVEADNQRRLDTGHSRADINALGEPGAGPLRQCACGCEVCAGDLTGKACAGGITVMQPAGRARRIAPLRRAPREDDRAPVTKPRNDGRPRIERAREAAKLRGYAAHDRSGEVSEALTDAMPIVEAALKWAEDEERGAAGLRVAIDRIKLAVSR